MWSEFKKKSFWPLFRNLLTGYLSFIDPPNGFGPNINGQLHTHTHLHRHLIIGIFFYFLYAYCLLFSFLRRTGINFSHFITHEFAIVIVVVVYCSLLLLYFQLIKWKRVQRGKKFPWREIESIAKLCYCCCHLPIILRQKFFLKKCAIDNFT